MSEAVEKYLRIAVLVAILSKHLYQDRYRNFNKLKLPTT